MALIQDWIEEKVGADLDALGLASDDQSAFADLSKKLLRDLDLTDGEMLPDDDDDGGSDDEGDEDDGSDDGEEGEDAGEQGEGDIDARGEQQESDDQDGESKFDEESLDDAEGEPGDDGDAGRLQVRPKMGRAEGRERGGRCVE